MDSAHSERPNVNVPNRSRTSDRNTIDSTLAMQSDGVATKRIWLANVKVLLE
jgi:hypothetical protein